METLATFIFRRLQELTVIEAEHLAGLNAVREERDQLRRAALAAGIAPDAAPEQTGPKAVEAQPTKRSPAIVRKLPSVTLKQAVLLVMKEGPKLMPAVEILNAINKRFDAEFPRTSLSPQLSRLRAEDGLLDRDGQSWFLTEKGRLTAENLSGQGDIFS